MNKSILKWAGNKSKIMPKISRFFPNEYERYLEPFAGSLGSFLNSGVPFGFDIHLNDLNKEVINLFECVKADPVKVASIANSYGKEKDDYLKIRALDRASGFSNMCKWKRAARVVYLNKTCFNGLWRENKKGHNNVPYGTPREADVLPIALANTFSQSIQNVNFYSKDYSSFLKIAKAGDLIYFDPPYVDLKDPKKEFNGYVGGFGWKEQNELVKKCKKLNLKGCFIIVSNSWCDATKELYKDFEMHKIQAPRTISRNKNGRKPVDELVAVLKV